MAQDNSDRNRRVKACDASRDNSRTWIARPISQEWIGTTKSFILFPVHLANHRTGNTAWLMPSRLKVKDDGHTHAHAHEEELDKNLSIYFFSEPPWVDHQWEVVGWPSVHPSIFPVEIRKKQQRQRKEMNPPPSSGLPPAKPCFRCARSRRRRHFLPFSFRWDA